MMKKTVLTSLIVLSTVMGFSQMRINELGLFLGGSYYTGDLNPSGHFNSLTRPAAGLIHRFSWSDRWSLRNGFMFGVVAGDDARSSSFAQQQRNLSFKSQVFEVHSALEFNFMPYVIGDKKRIFSPYMFLGVSGYHFDPKGLLYNQWLALQPLHTEGQSKAYMRTQISVPFGAGIKTMLAKRIGLCLEWGLRKTFTDYLDDVSTVYADPAVVASYGGFNGVALADRSISNDPLSNVGRQRGNSRTKDWYAFGGVTLSFKLNERQKRCQGYGNEKQ